MTHFSSVLFIDKCCTNFEGPGACRQEMPSSVDTGKVAMFWSGIMSSLLANIISNGLVASSRFYLDGLMRAWVWDIFEKCRNSVEEKVKCFQIDHLHAGHCFIAFIEEN